MQQEFKLTRRVFKPMLCGVLLAIALPAFAADGCNFLSGFSVWMGLWQTEGGKQAERWQRVSPVTLEGAMYGVNAKGQSGEQESMRILAMGGEIFYLAKVRHNPLPVAFMLTECKANRWVFTNTGHDFPKQISYTFNGTEALDVRVSGLDGKGFSLTFSKAQ
ncbi:DUF6265 family protein [Simiduia sp. 21SJ11W-1]|uniref:DUF6265 family protein n=1 Tax=Simiduia sp. 21SJ11W-1 TaxID=2909669 RepID=UPI00209F0C8F|nr:DUF6265 family protein [Simiduia sp. 21SJ11W-1]UTA46504.1 DUF6265 family protein [Simiduia sp. 21SJ11W-1]